MKISIIGTGHVGLVTGVCFAERGHRVLCYDIDRQKLARLRAGDPVIFEPGLEQLLRKNLEADRIRFEDDPAALLAWADVIFICVGTPASSDGAPDLSQVEEAARTVAEHLAGYKLIVEKSTVPVKTSEWLRKTINLYKRTDAPFEVASNPEFLREGKAIHDFLRPDRIVLGVESERAKELLTSLYSDFDCPRILTDINSAEIIKHASNSFLALKISFINMICDLCEKTGADIKLVAQGVGLDGRIGEGFLQAGIGYGGSCFPKDVRAFIRIAEDSGLNFDLLKKVEEINEDRIDLLLKKVKNALWIVKDKTIAVLGLSFKPDTDDVREAPSLKIVGKLQEQGARLRLYDPQAMNNMKLLYPERTGMLQYASDLYEAARGAHAVLILTEWEEFAKLDLERLRKLMITPILVDGRNVFLPQDARKVGFEYHYFGGNSP
ncbi:MAG: UDP-glucose/GDP-mannose dehydrogenase family protein [Acidobacteria bacterium]|nr:UDP-glucose/GDP-mannose dehydrogenase family protein [Acidobacteriota bacterium]